MKCPMCDDFLYSEGVVYSEDYDKDLISFKCPNERCPILSVLAVGGD